MRGGGRHVALAVLRRTIIHTYKNPAIIVPSLAFPLVFLLAFAGGLSAVSNVPGFEFAAGYTAFQFVFVFLQMAAFGGIFTGYRLAEDYESGFARRLMLGAPNRLGIVFGYLLAGLVRYALIGVILWALALATGMDVKGGVLDVVGHRGARRARQHRLLAVDARPRVPLPVGGHRVVHADAGLRLPLPRAGLRAARAAHRLAARRRVDQPGDADPRRRARVHHRRARTRCCYAFAASLAIAGLDVDLGDAADAPRRSRRAPDALSAAAAPPASPARITPGSGTSALIPNSSRCSRMSHMQDARVALLGVGVARGDDAALARMDELQDRVADPQPPALPALLGERLGVELDVDVRAKAAQVGGDVERRAERVERRADRDEQRVVQVLLTAHVAPQDDRPAEVGLERRGQRGIVPGVVGRRRAR